MLDTMTKTKLAIIIAGAVLTAVIAGTVGYVTAPRSSHAVPAAGLRAADQFAVDYTSANGIDSDNRISNGNDTTPQLADQIADAFRNGTQNAGFTVTGPAVDSGASPNVIVPTNQGPWRIQVTDYNGHWLVSKA